jgi:hypothetical protein
MVVGTMSTRVRTVVTTARRSDSRIAPENPDCLKMSGKALSPAKRSAA